MCGVCVSILRFLAARVKNLTVLSEVASGSYRGGNKDYNEDKARLLTHALSPQIVS